MTTINGQGCYCCICFTSITEQTCTVVNGINWDTCRDCEFYTRRKGQEIIWMLRKENQELKLKIQDLEEK